jgi:ubiquinone/menaquinone biosynthesis C-methylase UbiE
MQGSAECIPLPDASVDSAIASLLLHMLEEPAVGLREMCRVLRQGGRGLIVEWKHPRPDGKPGHRVPLNEMQRLLAEQGTTVIHENDWADTWYSLVFTKAGG